MAKYKLEIAPLRSGLSTLDSQRAGAAHLLINILVMALRANPQIQSAEVREDHSIIIESNSLSIAELRGAHSSLEITEIK